MRTSSSPDARIARLAARRFGVFTRADARRAGLTDTMIAWRVTTGRWERLDRNVYRIAGAPHSWEQSLLAACLSWDAAVASHRAAAALYAFPGSEPGIVELTIAPGRSRSVGSALLHRTRLGVIDITSFSAIPVTTPARTIIDLAAVLPVGRVEEALDDALGRRLVTRARLRARLDDVSARGRRGIGVVRRLLDARDPASGIPESALETRFLRRLRARGLPMPVPQFEIRRARRMVARVDLAYPEHLLAIEVDGYRFHSGRARWEHDLVRRNAVTALGWRVLHVTAADLAAGCEDVLNAIAAIVRPARHPRRRHV